jgi:WD40 repeat protein
MIGTSRELAHRPALLLVVLIGVQLLTRIRYLQTYCRRNAPVTQIRRIRTASFTFALIALVNPCYFAGRCGGAESKSPELLLPLGHTESITAVAFSGDGKRVVTGSQDGTALLWDAETGKSLEKIMVSKYVIYCISITNDGKRFVTGSSDGIAILCDADTARPVRTFKGHLESINSVALSRDERYVLTGSGTDLMNRTDEPKDNSAILWDAATGKPLRTFKGHSSPVNSVAISRDSKRVLTGSSDKTAVLWNAETAEPIVTLKSAQYVRAVAMSDDGKRLVMGTSESYGKAGSAVLWDIEEAKAVRTFKHSDGVDSVGLSGDGNRLLVSSLHNTVVWDVPTANSIRNLRDDRTGRGRSVRSAALSPDGNRLLTGYSDNTAMIWDAGTGEPIHRLGGRIRKIASIALCADGKRIITGFSESGLPPSGDATLWDLGFPKPIQTYKVHSDVHSMTLSKDNQRILTGSSDNRARLWEVESGKLLQTFDSGPHSGPFASVAVALSSDGKQVLTGSSNRTAVLWDVESGRPRRSFNHSRQVTSVAISTDGKRILTGSGYPEGAATLWDADSGLSIRTFIAGSFVGNVAMSFDGSHVLTSSDKVILWDSANGNRLRSFKSGDANIGALSLNETGDRLLTGSADMIAVLWDTRTGRALQTFNQHTEAISDVAFGPHESFFVTASVDGIVRFWKPNQNDPVFCFLSAGDDWLFWTPEGYYTCSPNGENLIAWKIHDDSPQGYRIVGPEQFRKKFYRLDMFHHLLKELDLTSALARADAENGRTTVAPTTIDKALPPVVLITEPSKDVEIDQETLTVQAVAVSVGGNPVARIRLLIDGRPYHGTLSTFEVPEPRLGKVPWSKEIDLEPGEHTVQVIAESAVSEGRSDILRIRRKHIVETLPRLFVLTIGVSAYEKQSLRKNVYYAAADARKFADTVERSSRPLYRDVQVLRLIDQDATRKKILQALAQIRRQATQLDAVLIFFAGHGTRDDQTNFYFLTVEADLDDLASTGLSEGDFKAQVKGIPGKVILLLDACHSGTLIENRGRAVDGPTDRLYRDLTSNEYGLVMMCSSKGLEVSKESPQLQSGFFAVAVVEGLEGKATLSSEGVVYFKALDAYVTERVKDLSRGEQHPLTSQDPRITNIPLTKP